MWCLRMSFLGLLEIPRGRSVLADLVDSTIHVCKEKTFMLSEINVCLMLLVSGLLHALAALNLWLKVGGAERIGSPTPRRQRRFSAAS